MTLLIEYTGLKIEMFFLQMHTYFNYHFRHSLCSSMIPRYPSKFTKQFCSKWDFIFFPPRGVEARPHSWPWVAKIKVGYRHCDRFFNDDDNEDETDE